jgi:hypothetical protein
MKVPTDATKVFKPVLANSSGSNQLVDATFPSDLIINQFRNTATGAYWYDRLRGLGASTSPFIESDAVVAEASNNYIFAGSQTTVTAGGVGGGFTFVDWFFRRAPSFFDEVCYTGTGSNTTQTHNLGAIPQLMIVKRRDTSGAWQIYSSVLANTEYLVLNTTAAKATGTTRWNSTTPTSTVFSIGTDATVNTSAGTYVAWLFATCTGVSKVGSYAGNGTTQTIDCGFTGGARFVLIKCTTATGDWYVYDTARGMTTLTDPYLRWNLTNAETATLGSVTTVSTGFALNSTILAAINTNGETFLFLAIA